MSRGICEIPSAFVPSPPTPSATGGKGLEYWKRFPPRQPTPVDEDEEAIAVALAAMRRRIKVTVSQK